MSYTPIILTCAVTGAMTVPSQSPYIPISPTEIAESAIESHRAGAAIVHIHVRDDDGRPCSRPELFKEVNALIRGGCEAIVQPTTGGGVGMTIEERAAVISLLEPEMASLNVGSLNFGIFPTAERITQWRHDWEESYLRSTRDYVFRNTFEDLEFMARVMREHGTKPELEVYDLGHLHNIVFLLDRGLLDEPVHIQFVLGVLGGAAALPEDLALLRQRATALLGPHTWSVAGVGYRGEFSLGTIAMLLGGHFRVGLEDNLRVAPGQLATSNAALVEKAGRIAAEFDRVPATPQEARELLSIRR